MQTEAERDFHKRHYRMALQSARRALSHGVKITHLKSAAQARRKLIGKPTIQDFDYAPVAAHGSPQYALRPASIPTRFLFAERRAA